MRYYYVSAIDNKKVYLVSGPYPTHSEALDKVKEVLHVADERDPRAWFMAWGTSGSDDIIKTLLGVI